MRIAIVKNGVVVNVVLAEAVEDVAAGVGETLIPHESAGPGWTFDGTTLTPPPAPVPEPVRVITPREFRQRFTDTEQAGIMAAAMQDVQVLDWRLRAAEARDIDLDHPETALGIDFLISKGLLAEGRKAEILA
jgi:hypothetical protein